MVGIFDFATPTPSYIKHHQEKQRGLQEEYDRKLDVMREEFRKAKEEAVKDLKHERDAIASDRKLDLAKFREEKAVRYGTCLMCLMCTL